MASAKTKSAAAASASTKPEKAPKNASAKSVKPAPEKAKAHKAEKGKAGSGKPGVVARLTESLAGVRQETKRVVWPSRDEMGKYSVAVVAMLIFFGVLIYLADTIIVPLLVAFSGLRG